ncbi:MAG: imidazoleglycerol-phosphate dehydratase [Gemmatimonadetes bacterium]|nr:imidazoleglycerol-phosphate dehydratase [Gemmatimonadota bacterium]
MSDIERETGETRVQASVRPGAGKAEVRVPDRFLAHMLETLARYSGLDMTVEADGDLRHHLVEDVAIALGLAMADEVPAFAARYGDATVPMDDALVHAAIDVGGRPYYRGRLLSRLYTHFLRSLACNLGATLHVRMLRGYDRHHVVEAAVKAVGLALRQALREGEAVFSTKGAVRIERRAREGAGRGGAGREGAGPEGAGRGGGGAGSRDGERARRTASRRRSAATDAADEMD